MSEKFYIDDCPKTSTIWNWISQKTQLIEASNDVRSNLSNELLDLEHRLDIFEIKKCCLQALDKNGKFGWRTSQGSSNAYGGLSLVYNPEFNDSASINEQTLGTGKNNPKEFYWSSTNKTNTIKNSYFDSYGFREVAPWVEEHHLNQFTNKFKLNLTRGRLAVLDSDYYDKVGEDFLWHKDETVFENLRINIPLQTDQSFYFQLEDHDPCHLSVGNVYSWDTHKPHRVFATEKKSFLRIHLVIGLMPWFSYDSLNKFLSKNKYFGKVHPLELLVNGVVHPDIGLT